MSERMATTPCDIYDDSDTDDKTNKRLSKMSLRVLETWFEDHSKAPYLDKLSLQRLTESTNLSKLQIQNWYVWIHYRHYRAERDSGNTSSMNSIDTTRC
ncbi:HMLALPHA2 [Candida oxycetoniae]|uniref:HMLALPHA2 n=1 Tax=Candida oxycetoniae TaxID=497107 RepID=A0AAI9SZ00_9ASCO|nr:HMLALPHA2 [Candida oxycetoniae]KAI3405263.2 HMLALPHA2 [Candida oxycetoniae]